MKALYDIAAPGKLNLFLHVLGQRADGLHLLQSAFVLIDWCDRLHFERRPGPHLTREDLTEALPPDDLVLRAARALQAAVGGSAGAHIGVEKYLPSQAGLGGGSSDAASCLLALNRLWGLDLPLAALLAIGRTLGADVPFFLRGAGAAWVEGIGERLTPLELPSTRWLVLKPPAGLSTAAVFTDPALKRDSAAATIPRFAADPWGFGRNDLQPVAERQCAAVGEGLGYLSAQGLAARMTGSGSAVFARLGQSGSVALELPAGWRQRECGNLASHPLAGWATAEG